MSRRIKIAVLFAVYAAVMLYLLLFGREVGFDGSQELSYWDYLQGNINLKPFRTIRNLLHAARFYLEHYGSMYYVHFAIRNVGGNLLLFIPLGVFLPMLWKRQRKFWLCLLTVMGLISMVEALQLFTTLGSMDVDDLILNTVGASLGFAFWRMAGRPKAEN